ncbi:MAG: 5'-methylthioadenosine/S-adenosylhomocysteine nucleosidase [Pseudomonadota bacterium]
MVPDTPRAPRFDDTPRIAIVSAFAPEWVLIRDRMSDSRDIRHLNRDFTTGTLSGRPVVVFQSGVSMINAALSSQAAISRFNLRGLVFSGVAGGADPDMGIGDIVIPDKWGQYLEMAFARASGDGYRLPPFLHSDFPNFGMIHTLNLGTFEALAGDAECRFWFPIDPAFRAAAERAGAGFRFARQDARGRRLTRAARIHTGGAGVSGSAFVDNAEVRDWAHRAFGACVLDMETAAVAQVADENGVPFIAVRALSDLAGGEAGANEFDIFMHVVGTTLADFVTALLAELPA